jgi:Flp pilus assembly protein TadD/TolB-like protein
LKLPVYILSFFLPALILAGPVQAQSAGYVRSSQMVLIMPFEAAAGAPPGSEWLGESFPEILGDRLRSGALVVIGSKDRSYALDRLGIPTSARLSRATIYEIAAQIEADYVITGRYSFDGSRITAWAEVMNMARLRLSPEVSESGPFQDLINAQTALAWDLVPALRAPGGAPEMKAGPAAKAEFIAQFPALRLDALENYIRGISAPTPQEKIRLLKEAVRLEPGHILAIMELARTYFGQRDWEQAAAWYTKVPTGDPSANEARFYQGLSFYYAGQLEKSEAAFRELTLRLPLTEVYNNLGAIAARRGDKRALGYFEKSAQTDASDADYRFNLAVQMFRDGDTAGATRRLREALVLRPDKDARALLDAIIAGTAAKDHLPPPRIKTNYDESSFRQLAAEIENVNEMRLSKTDPATHAAFHIQRGRELLESGLAGEAEKELREAVILDPVNASAHSALALVYEALEEKAGARSEARASLRLKPSAEAWLVLARLDLADHNPGEALQGADRALALEPENSQALALKRDIGAGKQSPQP